VAGPTRRYSDEEFAIILRTATQLQEDGSERHSRGSSEGMGLEEIQAIAREVGVDPERIVEAALMLGSTDPAKIAGRFGGPQKYELEATIPSELDEAQLARLVESIRKSTTAQGSVQTVLNSVEWSSVGELSQMHVTLSPRDGETSVQVRVDRTGAAAIATILPMLVWSVAAGAFGASTDPGTTAEIMTIIGTVVGGGLATTAVIWKSTGAIVARRVTRLLADLSADGRALIASSESSAALPPGEVE